MVVLSSFLGLPLAAALVLSLVQGLPPGADSIFRELLGLFGLPGAVAWGLWGYVAWMRIQNRTPAPFDEQKVLAMFERMAADERIQRARDYDQLAKDVANALQLAHARVETLLEKWTAEQQRRAHHSG